MNKIIINTEYISLSQLMKMESLVQSGGEAKQVIQQGLVSVNNEICTQRGRKLYKDDIVEFNGIEYIIS